MNSKRWQDQFPEEFKALESTLTGSDGMSTPSSILLNQALEKSILPEEKYFSWAQNEYQLPLLKLAFFADRPIDGKVWQKHQSTYPWDTSFLPVAEWDGHLIVACLEPKKLPQSLRAIYILCPLSGLKQLWQSYQHTSEFQLSDEAPLAEAANPPEDSLDLNLEIADGLDLNLADNPEALAPDAKSEASDFDGLLANTTTHVRLEKTTTTTQERETVIQEIPLAKAAEPVAVQAQAPKSVKASAQVVIEAPLELMPEAEAISKPIPPPPREQTLSSAPLASTPKITPAKTGREVYILDIIQKDKPQVFKSGIELAFTQMKESFERSILLSCDSKGLFIRPICGDEKFIANNEAGGTTLSEASIFSIVERTQKPFHGPIALNEINEKFFEDWNNGKIPSHVTLVPMINNDKVIGMLMGIGETTAYNKATLQMTEKAAHELLTKLIPSVAAKAA